MSAQVPQGNQTAGADQTGADQRPGQPGRRAPRPDRPLISMRVVRREQLAPHMVRLVFGGGNLADFPANGFADQYVKLEFGDVTRTFTVRWWDPDRQEMAIDFVVHGSEGLAGVWADNAQIGAEISMRGPGGKYRPDPDADWHLLVGDESALPAIAAALEQISDDVPVRVVLKVEDASEEQPMPLPAGAQLIWVHRASAPGHPGDALVEAVRGLERPAGRVHAFVHGEAGFVKDLRRYLRGELNVPREDLSVSGYWRRGRTDEVWRREKRDWNREVEEHEQALAAGASDTAPS